LNQLVDTPALYCPADVAPAVHAMREVTGANRRRDTVTTVVPADSGTVVADGAAAPPPPSPPSPPSPPPSQAMDQHWFLTFVARVRQLGRKPLSINVALHALDVCVDVDDVSSFASR
jgi:hypothetical protein